MREDIQERARRLALYIVENNATVRSAARHFSVSKSTVHKDGGVIIRIEFQRAEKVRIPAIFS
ncbi:MAG: sporulation transcriptional regulator SpoIIID [Oscillospiraceae bacterium]|nr:sporulation transcriptional regulator SpoIIID [Oscillospiraceae bacterium]